MKRIGFLSFGHWSASSRSQVRSASDALIQSIELAEAVRRSEATVPTSGSITSRSSWRRLSRSWQRSAPEPSASRSGRRSSTCATRTPVHGRGRRGRRPHRRRSPAARHQRGSPEQVIEGFRHFGHVPVEGATDADMAREKTEVFLQALTGAGLPNPTPPRAQPARVASPGTHSPGCATGSGGRGIRATADGRDSTA